MFIHIGEIELLEKPFNALVLILIMSLQVKTFKMNKS